MNVHHVASDGHLFVFSLSPFAGTKDDPVAVLIHTHRFLKKTYSLMQLTICNVAKFYFNTLM